MLISDAIGIVAPQSLRVDTELRAQLVRRLISDAAVELKQTAATGIERRILAQRQRRRTNARILVCRCRSRDQSGPSDVSPVR